MKTQNQERQDLEQKSKKAKGDQLIEVKANIKALENKIGESIETKELIILNKNALAHEQEHLCKFMVNFLIVTVGLLLSSFIFFCIFFGNILARTICALRIFLSLLNICWISPIFA